MPLVLELTENRMLENYPHQVAAYSLACKDMMCQHLLISQDLRHLKIGLSSG